MAIGDPVEIQKLDDDNELSTYMKTHALKINKTRSSEFFEVGGEQVYAYITFFVRHNQMFDIVGYDDYMEQHRIIELHCRSIRGGEYG